MGDHNRFLVPKTPMDSGITPKPFAFLFTGGGVFWTLKEGHPLASKAMFSKYLNKACNKSYRCLQQIFLIKSLGFANESIILVIFSVIV
jgi:hypothetical protein